MNSVICIVCALPCEAKPLIEHFGLGHKNSGSPFKTYHGERIALVVSGVGKINAAAATSYLYASCGATHPCPWINVGIAGHGSLSKGDGFLASKVCNETSHRSFFPSFAFRMKSERSILTTVDKPVIAYDDGMGYDMEAYGFYAIASRISPVELVHCYKVVSDTPEHHTSAINKSVVSGLVCDHLVEIEKLLEKLLGLSRVLCDEATDQAELEIFLSRYHFSSTQEHMLRRLLKRYKACSPEEAAWDSSFANVSTAKEVLHRLEAKINDTPLSYG